MKKTFRILSVMALACLVVFGSCKKNENGNNNSTNENGTLSAGIVQPNNGAKTSITINGNEGIIKWTEGDQIVVGDAAQSGTFTLLEGAGESTAVFRCPNFPVDELDYYTAAYPASAATVSGTAVTFNIPAEQTLTRIEDGFGNGANPMVAYATAPLNQLEFKSVFGGVGIKLKAQVPASITKLVLTDNNNYLCGQFSVADVTVDEPSAAYVSGGGHSITLNLPAGGLRVDSEGCNVYIMLPVGALSNGFTLDAYVGETLVTHKEPDSSVASAATITLNNINNAVTYNVELPAGQASTPEAVMAIIADPEQTGPVTIVGGGTLDFGGYTAPNNQQIVVGEDAEVEIKNLNATTSTAAPAMIISSGANATLNNVSLVSTSTASNSRAINVVGTDTEVTLVDCTIDGGTAGYSRGLNVYDGNATVNVVGGSIHAGHYAINIPGSGNGVTINLSDASVAAGWSALNVWGGNNTIIATNCELYGTNDKTYNSGGWNDFATIVFEYSPYESAATNAHDCTIELTDCDVYASAEPGENRQWALLMSSTGNTFIMTNGSINGTDNNDNNWYAFNHYVAEEEWNAYLDNVELNWPSDPSWPNYDGGKRSMSSVTSNQEVSIRCSESSKD